MERVAKMAAIGCVWLVLGLALLLPTGCSRNPTNTTAAALPEAAGLNTTVEAAPAETAPPAPEAPPAAAEPPAPAPAPAAAAGTALSAQDCKPWEDWDPASRQCPQSSHAHVHALGYEPGAGEICWRYATCLCREGLSPGADSCAPCSQEAVQVICRSD